MKRCFVARNGRRYKNPQAARKAAVLRSADLGARGRTTDRSEAMARVLFPLFTILALFSALARSAAADAPAEQASSVTVVIFLVLFIGSCVAFAAYVWWNGRKKGSTQGR
jgi:hypothetical protein